MAAGAGGRPPMGKCPDCGGAGGVAIGADDLRLCPHCDGVWRDGGR